MIHVRFSSRTTCNIKLKLPLSRSLFSVQASEEQLHKNDQNLDDEVVGNKFSQ